VASTLENDSRPEYYDKPFLSVPEQIEKLVDEKGLLVQDREHAAMLLRTIGYYRLSGYWHFFRNPIDPKTLRAGTSIHDVHALYVFDQELKQRISAGAGFVEVALRFQLGHQLGKTDTFAHLDPDHLNTTWTRTKPSAHSVLGRVGWQDSEHAKFSKKVHAGEKQSAELFVDHFKDKYKKPHLPAWVATELFSFGMVTALYDGSKQDDQQRIASALGFVDETEIPRPGDLSSVLNHLRYVRNICAHHSRLWNRGIDVPVPKLGFIPELSHLNSHMDGAKPRVYDTLALLAYLVGQLDSENSWRLDTVAFIKQNLEEAQGLSLSYMGFPDGWQAQDLWRDSYRPSYQGLQQKARLLEYLPHVPIDEAGGLFRLKNDKDATNSFTARKKRARYARNKGALIGVRMNNQIQVPVFQIDTVAQDLVQSVADFNVRFFSESRLDPLDDASHLAALSWWLSPSPDCAGISPLKLQESGALTEDAFEAAIKTVRPSSL
jgi:abortive infection bacteriophage resistance protein